MRPLGKVVGISPKGAFVVKAVFAPELGQRAVDMRSRPVGKVIRLTGPVSSPYVLLAPFDLDEPKSRLMGRDVFIDEGGQREQGRRRERAFSKPQHHQRGQQFERGPTKRFHGRR